MRFVLSAASALVLVAAIFAQQAVPLESPGSSARFVDVTTSLGVSFEYKASHTEKHYLPETMGAGVALLDYDNDNRLDIFLVNGAPINDPTPNGAIPQKTGKMFW